MAQTGFTPISNYYSATATNVPTAGNLVAGELAINTADGKLFYKDSGGVVQTLATKTAATFPNVNGSTSGAVTLAAPAVAGTNTATLPAATGTVMVSGNMPAFSAYGTVGQSLTAATFTKVQLNNEEFDTNNCFDSTTNYRFTPTVAGYYQINASIVMTGTITRMFCSIYKNGSEYKRGNDLNLGGYQPGISSIVYCNGTTDYIELYCWANGTGLATAPSSREGYMNGSMIRSA